jgi:formate-dependent nitrite reductase membrane component NrfD
MPFSSGRGGSQICSAYFTELALVNVDYVSPSLWLGVFVCVSGLTLYTFKLSNAKGMKDVEIVTASLLVLAGGILSLQGWRLDPILMLSEGVLASVGLYYIIQTVELRKELQVSIPVCGKSRIHAASKLSGGILKANVSSHHVTLAADMGKVQPMLTGVAILSPLVGMLTDCMRLGRLPSDQQLRRPCCVCTQFDTGCRTSFQALTTRGSSLKVCVAAL